MSKGHGWPNSIPWKNSYNQASLFLYGAEFNLRRREGSLRQRPTPSQQLPSTDQVPRQKNSSPSGGCKVNLPSHILIDPPVMWRYHIQDWGKWIQTWQNLEEERLCIHMFSSSLGHNISTVHSTYIVLAHASRRQRKLEGLWTRKHTNEDAVTVQPNLTQKASHRLPPSNLVKIRCLSTPFQPREIPRAVSLNLSHFVHYSPSYSRSS